MDYSDFEFAYPQYPLAPHTCYKVGGPASIALLPRTVEETKSQTPYVRLSRRRMTASRNRALLRNPHFHRRFEAKVSLVFI